MSFLIFVISFVVLFCVGMPVGFAMITSSVVYALSADVSLTIFSMEMFSELNSFTLIAIPMFMLTAEVMNNSTVSDRMFDVCNGMVGWIPGGLAHTNVVTSVVFAGMSGSAAADAGGVGFLEYDAMVKRGFDKAFSAACTAASSCIGPIIPPSIPVIVYVMAVPSASVGRMLIGGVIPGLLMALFMCIWVYYISKKRNYPVEKRPTRGEMLLALKRGILPILTPVVLLASISSGAVTISEGAVVTSVYAIILGVIVYRQMGLKGLIESAKNVFVNCGVTLMFFAGGTCFSHVLAKENIPAIFSDFMLGLTDNHIILLLLINVFFFIMGCLSDPVVNITLFAPMVVPIVRACGMDLDAFGVILILNCIVGLITPPVGTMVYIIAGLAKEPLSNVFKECMPYVICFYLLVLLMTVFPEIVTCLPNLLMGTP